MPWEGNYYPDDIDIKYLNVTYINDKVIAHLKALHRTALVLATEARLTSFNGNYLKNDEVGNVSLSPAEVFFEKVGRIVQKSSLSGSSSGLFLFLSVVLWEIFFSDLPDIFVDLLQIIRF